MRIPFGYWIVTGPAAHLGLSLSLSLSLSVSLSVVPMRYPQDCARLRASCTLAQALGSKVLFPNLCLSDLS